MTDNKKLQIGLEVSSLINHGQDIGAGRYILNLIKGLLTVDSDNSYFLFGTYTDNKYLDLAYSLGHGSADDKIRFKFLKVSGKYLRVREKLGFPPVEFTGFKADIFHCMDYMIPPTFSKNIVLTIHDLAFMRFPEFNFDWFIKKYSRMVRRNAGSAKKILASSES
ncbi:MAG: hypothetical protein MUP02_08440, partial [Actinobacteria bacterium]|nr:hypothetical protein [Actinomycetota bacterium]